MVSLNIKDIGDLTFLYKISSTINALDHFYLGGIKKQEGIVARLNLASFNPKSKHGEK